MFRRAVLALAVGAVAVSASAADPVPVKGSSATFARSVAVPVGGKDVTLRLTGTGLRTKAIFNVYAIGSYVQDGATARTAEDLPTADAVKMLHLVMERTVEAADLIGTFKAAVGKIYPADKFAAEFAKLSAALGDRAARKGDHVTLVAAPGAGIRFRLGDAVEVTVGDATFARAVWEVYFGSKPVDEGLKKGLTSLLPK
jgi:hypothetical protein